MAVQVVTGENREAFMAAKLGLATSAAEAPKEEVEAPKQEAKEEPKVEAKTEEPAKEEKKAEPEVKEGERIRLKTERQKAKEEAAAAKEEAAKLRKELDALRGNNGDEPDPGKFKDAVEYGKAYGEWLAAKRVKETEERQAKEAAEREQQRVTAEWNKRYKKAAKEIEDFEDVIMGEPLTLQPAVISAIYESEVGPQLHYILSKDPDEADKINSMGPAAAIRYLGRLEAKIEAENAIKGKAGNVQAGEAPRIPQKPRPVAPEPIRPIEAVGAAGTGVVDSDGNVVGSFADYKAARRAGKIR